MSLHGMNRDDRAIARVLAAAIEWEQNEVSAAGLRAAVLAYLDLRSSRGKTTTYQVMHHPGTDRVGHDATQCAALGCKG